MKKQILVSVVGEGMDTIFQVIRTFPTEKVVLISSKEGIKAAKAFQKDLDKFRIPASVIRVDGYTIEELVKTIKGILDSEKDILINISSGDKISSSLTLCAAYIHGVKAVGVQGDSVVSLPIMKFSYYKSLSDQKLSLLRILYRNRDCCSSLEELSRKASMSLPLISYHINGNRKVEGLKQMGLVDIEESRRRLTIHLSELGRILMLGYV